MIKLNYENKKMIADFIENKIFYNDIEDNEKRVLDIYEIYALISELRTVTFGEIKNNVNIKFKPEGYDSEFIVAEDNFEKKYLVNITNGLISELSIFSDDKIVEILKK